MLSGNGAGIYLEPGPQELAIGNLVYENTIIDSSRVQPRTFACSVGGGNNTISLNNFLDPTVQALGANAWDSRLNPNDLLWGGNYWSDYNQTNKYGMGTDPYVIDANNVDHHPLTGMVNIFDVPYGYVVAMISNSSISDFKFTVSNESQAVLDFEATGENGTQGLCWVIVPQVVINYSRTWTVTLDGSLLQTHEYSVSSNETHWNFWIDYPQSIHQIQIAGFTTLPEFPTSILLSLFIIATLLAVVVYKRRC